MNSITSKIEIAKFKRSNVSLEPRVCNDLTASGSRARRIDEMHKLGMQNQASKKAFLVYGQAGNLNGAIAFLVICLGLTLAQ